MVLANCCLDVQRTSDWVASRFSLPVGETDALAPVRAKEWVWERVRVVVVIS
jgi:hypothetical protein